MKSNQHGKVKISKELMDEFMDGCVTNDRYSGVRFSPTDEQRELLLTVFSQPTCNRKKFVQMWKEKYNFGSVGMFKDWFKREGIELPESAYGKYGKQYLHRYSYHLLFRPYY